MGSLLDDDCDGVRCCKAGGSWPAGGCNEKVVPSGDICLSTSHGVLTSSLKKHTFYNLLINNILYLCVT